MWSRSELKTRAKEILRVSYWKAFLVSIIIAVVGGNNGSPNINWNFGRTQNRGIHVSEFSDVFLSPMLITVMTTVFIVVLLLIAFRIFIGYALEVGGRRYFIQSANRNFDLNSLGYAFDRTRYMDIFKSMLWRGFINFLWYLLLIIPGIVKSYAYMMVPYILADNPNIGYRRALELSNEMTMGEKFDIFILDLSFIGWYLLGVLALFVGTLFVMPYQNATNAELYLVLRKKALERGICTYEELKLIPETYKELS